MRISCQSFSLPKAGRSFVDCEDAYFPGELDNRQLYETAQQNVNIFRASVCDGATDSIFSKLWAQLLASAYGAGKWASSIDADSIKEEQSAWLDFLAKQKLPWYAEEKAELGAFAAMAGLTLHDEQNKWSAMAVGDCCIFHIRGSECIRSFPIDNSSAFSNFPLLLSSVAERNSKNVFDSSQVISDGNWQSGDQFILMSDTVACWFLTQVESGHADQVITALDSAKSLDAFASLIDQARTTRGTDGNVLMRDDDVTVTLIRVLDSTSSPVLLKFDSEALNAASRAAESATARAQPGSTPTKNNVDLPPLPDKRQASVLSQPQAQAQPQPQPQIIPPYDDAASGNNSSAVSEGIAGGGSYATRSKERQQSNQSGLVGLIVALSVIAAGGIGVALMSSQRQSEKHVKVEQEPDRKSGQEQGQETGHEPGEQKGHQPQSITPPVNAEAAALVVGNHHVKHKTEKKAHSVGPGPSGVSGHSGNSGFSSSSTISSPVPAPSPAPESAPGNNATSNASSIPGSSASPRPASDGGAGIPDASGSNPDATSAPGGSGQHASTPDAIPSQTTGSAATPRLTRQIPQAAPEHNAGNRIRPTSKTRSMPEPAPNRVRMPLPAPDRNSGLPVPLPEHVRHDNDSQEHMHSNGSHHHHRLNSGRSNGSVGTVGIPQDKIIPDKRRSDMPENLSN